MEEVSCCEDEETRQWVWMKVWHQVAYQYVSTTVAKHSTRKGIICEFLHWWEKSLPHFIDIWEYCHKTGELYSIHLVPSYDLTLLA